jgi:hypothetical protein
MREGEKESTQRRRGEEKRRERRGKQKAEKTLMFAHIYIICTSRDLCHQFPVLQAFRKSRRSGHRNTICIIALSLI